MDGLETTWTTPSHYSITNKAGEKSKRAANPMEKDQPPRTMIMDRVEKGGCNLDPIAIMS